MKLTADQKIVLLNLLRYEGWTSDIPIINHSLTSLQRKGLIEFAYDTDEIRYVEKLTSKGREIANEIKERIDK